ncbi:M23 family metallopeptidase (plasmid) [Adhaeribacter swui]|uniref:M23 family metallopeptidase n=1 Tax=Adhaeribacter swui TaxID=2086471 RepID=A0A7G7G2H5_9BACT|nr:M23 family metallopeptidase [Adhaeribacter swui]QNF31359.1 M23 family metallopeptidase [Adhaeribacter swui]
MKLSLLLILFFLIASSTQAQFNTVKKQKPLLEIQADTVNQPGTTSNPENLPKPASVKPDYLAASMPLTAPYINSGYGNRMDPLTGKTRFHAGIDFKGASDSVMVILPGRVSKVGYSGGLGNYVEVTHADFTTVYGHLSGIAVREGMYIKAGTLIGLTGSTGRSTGDHLHFALKYKGRIVNPTPFLDEIYRATELNYRRKITALGNN